MSIWTCFVSSLRRLWGPRPVADDEELARFLFSRNDFKRTHPQVKLSAFMPSKTGMTSVFRKSRMSGRAYVKARRAVSRQRGAEAKATALVLSSSVFELGLEVIPEESQHRWHADISGWWNDTDEYERTSKAKVLAAELAEVAWLE